MLTSIYFPLLFKTRMAFLFARFGSAERLSNGKLHSLSSLVDLGSQGTKLWLMVGKQKLQGGAFGMLL